MVPLSQLPPIHNSNKLKVKVRIQSSEYNENICHYEF